MKKAGYPVEDIERYKAQSRERFNQSYNMSAFTLQPVSRNSHGKRPRPTSSSDSSETEEFNEFDHYLRGKRDTEVSEPLKWWSQSQSMFPKLAKMARDVYAVPATGAGVEREFSISGRVVTKQRNRLSSKTIGDLMQYKRWAARHGSILTESVNDIEAIEDTESDVEDEDKEKEEEEEEDDINDLNKALRNWLEEWAVKEKITQRAKRLGRIVAV